MPYMYVQQSIELLFGTGNRSNRQGKLSFRRNGQSRRDGREVSARDWYGSRSALGVCCFALASFLLLGLILKSDRTGESS
ncbi:hypothetical protein BDV34DRAFT_178473 [Aspergillus parasiticus]|uniref:Uncharacterized protein n=1 Tax=Aspergillus parasiticus TaxID=5067 RepID=A0A5N6D769_ASPPA|nr:hypothetical protein BDV34DRAFT_178473 [Aspergillus parasiticus]